MSALNLKKFKIPWQVLIIFCGLSGGHTTLLAQAQMPANGQVSIAQIFQWVQEYHPIVKQINTLPEMARMDVRIARGKFDPYFHSSFQEKMFKDSRYYNDFYAGVKAPLWIGDIKGDFERLRGDFINPQNSTPFDGLYTLGYSLPLGQGLFTDYRRNALQQAKLFVGMAQADQIKLINKLLLDIAKDYWEWFFAAEQAKFIQEGLELAEFRYNATKDLVKYGQLAPIDSLEALNNLQLRQIQFEQSQLELRNAALYLSNHLWDDNLQPLFLPLNAEPVYLNNTKRLKPASIDSLRNLALFNHPELVKIGLKIDQLLVERRFRYEMLKPIVNVDYNLLTFPSNSSDIGSLNYARNNYKAGFTIGMPLFLREERGKLRQTQIKIQQSEFEQIMLNREIQNNINAAANEIALFDEQVRRQQELVINLRKLLEGEQEKFINGESSVFIINARETNLINGEVKLAELKSKLAKAYAFLNWAAGVNNWQLGIQ